MNVFVDGQPIEPKAVTFSERGHGRMPGELKCQLEMDAAEFLRRLRPVYDECIAELQHDDAITGHFHPPYPGATAYPTLDELMLLPPEAHMPFVDTYLVFDILRLWLPEESAASAWLLSRCDAVEQREGKVVVHGRVRRAAPPR